jgi:hypothetical protein
MLSLHRWSACRIGLLVSVAVWGFGLLPDGQAADSKPAVPAKDQAPTDLYQDPLPPGAVARMGTVRFRHNSTCVA